MDATRRPDHADPDFDPSPGQRPGLRDFDPAEHQRLVMNPFLAVLGLIGLTWLARALLASHSPVLAGLLLIPLALLPNLIQYHCLDCGRTGTYRRHAGHACPGVLARWREGRYSRFPFPTPWAQLVVWGWAIGAAAVILAVVTLA